MGSALLTFIPRVLPLMLFSKIQIPMWLLRWLEYVPVAVMAALIGQELFMSDNQLVPITHNAGSVGIPAYDCSSYLDTQSAGNRIGRYCGYDDTAILDRIIARRFIRWRHSVMKTLFSIVTERDKMETEVFSVSIFTRGRNDFNHEY